MGKTCAFPPAQTYYIKSRNVAPCMPKPWHGVFPHCLFFFPHSNKGFYLSYVIPGKKTQFSLQQISAMHCFFCLFFLTLAVLTLAFLTLPLHL